MVSRISVTSLTASAQTLLIPLYYRALETREGHSCFRDDKALEIVDSLDYDFSKIQAKALSLEGVILRAQEIDRHVSHFLAQNPDEIVIEIGCGLDTRFNRVDNGSVTWFDLDFPEVIALRRQLMTETPRHQFLLPQSKELIAERGTIRNDVKGWDKAILLSTTILGPAMLLVAGLDDRYGWAPFQLYSARIGAVVVMCLSYALVSWAMATNAYFSATGRVQQDRGQTVITSGPYRFVRHPGYVGMIVSTFATPLILGSILAFVPAALLILTIITRTWLEDRPLQRELNGYETYIKKVHYRLIPGLW